MKFELLRSSHSVGEANYHMQFTPAYRQKIFEDEDIKIWTRDTLLYAAQQHRIAVAAIGFGPDHCHIFVVGCKNQSPSKVANLLKGISSRMMRKYFREHFSGKLWGEKFWSAGYFYRTIGAVNNETVKVYIEQSQEKHWEKSEKKPIGLPCPQRKLLEFAA